MSVEGILLEDVFGVDERNSLEDAIFCVHLQRQYSASRDLNAFLKHYDMDERKIEDEGAKRHLKALKVINVKVLKNIILINFPIYRGV